MLIPSPGIPNAMPPPAIIVRLGEVGYENLRLLEASDSCTVWYENRRHFSQLAAMAEVLAIVAPLATPDATLAVVPLREDQPMLRLLTRPEAVTVALKSRTPLAAEVVAAPNAPSDAFNTTALRTDLAIQPSLRFDQETYAYLARASWQSGVTRGISMIGRIQAPFYPAFAFDSPRVALRASGWLWPEIPGVFQLGWDKARPHVAGEIGYLPFGGVLGLKLNGGFVQGQFPQLVGKAELRLPWWDLIIGGGGGQWLLGDGGPFVMVSRTFPRSVVEVAAFRTQYGTQFRATFGIDLGYDPRPAPGVLRVLPIGFWQFRYFASAYTAAAPIEPEPSVDDFVDRLTPAYVSTHLDKLPWPD